ncbi:hypothetical protein RZS08_06775 [Arthrospira platensis SPKY1]|nr:hypothetical protein [Arthrospira platensis SPKY1]
MSTYPQENLMLSIEELLAIPAAQQSSSARYFVRHDAQKSWIEYQKNASSPRVRVVIRGESEWLHPSDIYVLLQEAYMRAMRAGVV